MTIKTTLTGKNAVIPVVMFHSVGIENTDWIYRHLSEPLALFEAKIALLCKKGFRFIFWHELYDYMAGTRKLPAPAIMLTFDDGYLDNWVYVYPILKKYDAKATIFINPEFVDPSTSPRPNLKRSSAKTEQGDLPVGFLNWTEINKMVNSGLVDIQSHSLTHTWYYSKPALIDFHRPGCHKYPWLVWNHAPENKYRYMQEDISSLLPWGTPVFKYEKSLCCRKYFPPEEVIDGLVTYVHENGKENFFSDSNWNGKLNQIFEELMIRHKDKEYYETQEQYESRIFFELKESKHIIEERLNKPVDFLCFPGGGYNPTVLALAKKAGYKGWTLASKDESGFRNLPDTDPTQIKRIGAFSKYRFRGKIYGAADEHYFLNVIKQHQGAFLYKWLGRGQLFWAMLKNTVIRRQAF